MAHKIINGTPNEARPTRKRIEKPLQLPSRQQSHDMAFALKGSTYFLTVARTASRYFDLSHCFAAVSTGTISTSVVDGTASPGRGLGVITWTEPPLSVESQTPCESP